MPISTLCNPLGRTAVDRMLALLGMVLLALPTAAETPGAVVDGVSISERDRAFEDSVDVELVNVEVRVADRKGRAITGLSLDDFELFEDRKPVEILHFAEINQGRLSSSEDSTPLRAQDRSSPTSSPRPAPASPNVGVSNPASPNQGVSDPAHLIFYFDNSHLRPGGRHRAIQDIRGLLDDGLIDPGKVLLLSQSPRIQTLAAFGSSKEEVLHGLDHLAEQPAKGLENDRQRQLFFDHIFELFQSVPEDIGIDLTPCELLRTDGIQETQTYAQRVSSRVSVTLRHLATLSSALAGIPGPKVVLYVGDGLELVPMADPIHYLIEVCPQLREQFQRFSHSINLTTRFQQLTRHANGNRVTFYTLSAGGMPLITSSSVEFQNFKWKPSTLNDEIRRSNLENSLSFMASDTGGRAIFNTNQFRDEILKVQEEAYAYYSLAYEPPNPGDGQTHMIDVKVRKKGARVRHRMSYRDKASDERMADRLQAALTLGVETNPMGISISRGPAKLGDRKSLRRLPMWITVPLESLVFVPEGDGHVGRLRMQIAARDPDGKMSAFHQKHFEVELDPGLAGKAEGEHTFVVDLDMRSGPHIVAVGLRDEVGRETSYLASRITVE